jgi:hypothetical protein
MSGGVKLHGEIKAQTPTVDPPFAHAHMSNHRPMHTEGTFFRTE